MLIPNKTVVEYKPVCSCGYVFNDVIVKRREELINCPNGGIPYVKTTHSFTLDICPNCRREIVSIYIPNKFYEEEK